MFVYFKIVIVIKFCCNESFMFFWCYFDGEFVGWFMIWLYLFILLCFIFMMFEVFEFNVWWI